MRHADYLAGLFPGLNCAPSQGRPATLFQRAFGRASAMPARVRILFAHRGQQAVEKRHTLSLIG